MEQRNGNPSGLNKIAFCRGDGRSPGEIRRINARLSVFSQADGSAFLQQGLTKVLATVYGPHQPRGKSASNMLKAVKGIVNCQYSTAVFSFGAGVRKKRPRGDRKSQEREQQLRHAMEAIINLELFAKSQIDIFIEVLQVDGSEFCVAVNAATLALIDAGIPIKDYAIACSITVADDVTEKDEEGAQDGGSLIDANWVEECSPGFTLSVVSLPKVVDETQTQSSLILAHGAGRRLHLSRLEALRQRALDACKDIRVILDDVVRNHLHTHAAIQSVEK